MDPTNFTPGFRSYINPEDFDVAQEDYDRFQGQIAFIEQLSQVQNSSVIVFDFYKAEYAFRRIQFSDVLGHDPEKADELGLGYYVSLIHPDDHPVLLDAYIKTFTFIDQLPVEEKKDYKLIYNFRTRGSDGKYYAAVDQIVVLELDRKGNVWMILGITDMLPSKSELGKASRQLINVKTNARYLFNDDKDGEKSVLSTREVEVLGLVSKGFASKEIAERLFISVNTVNNHRQKILEKTQTSNTAEAVSYARSLGLV
ncbi:MAG: hypothetical protein JW801_03700 [Bacteroidales bacterium]|nr:hypothetical protein [Bacteroidales bacterium]